MTSSYSTDLKLELMVTGENAGTWGDNTNNNLNLIQQAVAGFESLALNDGGNLALAMTDKTISTARNMVIKFTGSLTGASTVTVPDTIEKFYIFDCSAVSGPTNLTIKTASGTGFTLDAAKIYAAYTDGTNLNEISLDTLGGTVAAANITGTIATSQIANDAITSAKIADNAVLTVNISNANVTTAKIDDDAVTTAKILNDNVTADKLADTTVSAGSYTLASVTVDAQGRLTAASSGVAGGANMVLRDFIKGPASGTFTANASATKIVAYVGAGGGQGGNGDSDNNGNAGGPGGPGGFGVFSYPITAPYAEPYTVGGAAGATSIGSPVDASANAGNAGEPRNNSEPAPSNPGNPGTSPGAKVSYDSGGSLTSPLTSLLSFQFQNDVVLGGAGGNLGNPSNIPGSAGRAGFLLIYEDLGA